MRPLAGAAAVVLAVSLWLPWFKTGAEGAYFNRSVDEPAYAGVFVVGTAWESAWGASPAAAAALLALAAVVAAGVLLAQAGARRGIPSLLAGRGTAVVAAFAALCLVAVRIARPPRLLDDDLEVQVFGALDRLGDGRLPLAWGAWVALAAALVAAAATTAAARRSAG